MYFDIDAHKGCFKTNPDEAYFWHGHTNGCGGQNNAMNIAEERNGKTLENCMLDNRNELERAGVRFRDNDDGTVSIDYGNNRAESKQFWDDCSKSFAEQSSGNVHVIEGSDLRPNGQFERDYPSVYNRIEHPALEQNHNVNSITHIDPYTRQTTEIESLHQRHSNPLSSGNGKSTPCGASTEDLPPIQPMHTSSDVTAGPDNLIAINRNTAEAGHTASRVAESGQNATKSMTGGMV